MSVKEIESIDIYEQGNVELRVYTYTDPTQNDCWLKIGGCCGLQVRSQEFQNLVEVMNLYKKQSRRSRLWKMITFSSEKQGS